jgi:hypothetical protein
MRVSWKIAESIVTLPQLELLRADNVIAGSEVECHTKLMCQRSFDAANFQAVDRFDMETFSGDEKTFKPNLKLELSF